MLRYDSHGDKPVGSAPGTVMYIGEERTEPVVISCIRYDADSAVERAEKRRRAALADRALLRGSWRSAWR